MISYKNNIIFIPKILYIISMVILYFTKSLPLTIFIFVIGVILDIYFQRKTNIKNLPIPLPMRILFLLAVIFFIDYDMQLIAISLLVIDLIATIIYTRN